MNHIKKTCQPPKDYSEKTLKEFEKEMEQADNKYSAMCQSIECEKFESLKGLTRKIANKLNDNLEEFQKTQRFLH
jgi:F0F1-type ATP synthase membrane subunit b/b'